MATSLFEGIIFGPIKSRRLGVSLGINLLPEGIKLCNFNCIYCECGWNRKLINYKARFHPKIVVEKALEQKLIEMKETGEALDAITFSGNGEPTMHPEFADIIDDTIKLRDKYFPNVQVCVLSNGSNVHHVHVLNALKKIDRAILKFESAFEETVRIIDNPQVQYSTEQTIENFKKMEGDMVLQTMFLRGEYNGHKIDNTVDKEVNAWLEAVKQINPKEIMIYTIDRDTPAEGIVAISNEELERIANKARALGYTVQVAGSTLADNITL